MRLLGSWLVRSLACCLFLLAAGPLAAVEPHDPLASEETGLDRYVNKPDSSFRWKVVDKIPGPGCTTYVIDMVSQTWRASPEVDRAEWQHWLLICKPDKVEHNQALLLISGGGNGGDPPKKADDTVPRIAVATGSVVAELKMVPNQPLIFENDGHKRSEDDLIAYTWDKFMVTGDETWVARLPMVKSAVRAMDTITAFMASPDGGETKVDEFVVAGGSKRGWTTWNTAAVDRRVVAIIPAVIDVLNVKESMKHHYEAYGYWSPAVWDYVRHKIMPRQNTPEYTALLKIEDPFNYRARLTMPKFILNAAGDEFFLPDSSQFYWNELKGEKHLRYVANAKHSLAGSDARESLAAFYHAVINDKPRPKYDWSFESDGSIRVVCEDAPKEVVVWQATNPKARDFRLDSIGKAYKSMPLEDQGGHVYVARAEKPPEGFTAYFVEMTFDSGWVYPLKFTSGVRVTPDELPHKGKLEQTLEASGG